jgi:hypothetical protein
MDLHSYKRRLENGSKNSIDNTKKFINDNFAQSPFYQIVLINGEEIEAIINDEKTTEEKTLLLRPNTNAEKGKIVELNNHSWLIMDFNNDQIYPTLKLRLCNQLLKSVVDGSEIPVVALGKRTDFDEDEEYLIVTTNEISIYASYQQAKTFELQDRFTMNLREYEIIGIDDVTEVYEAKGIVKFTMERTDTPAPPMEEETDTTTETPTETTPTEEGGWGDW